MPYAAWMFFNVSALVQTSPQTEVMCAPAIDAIDVDLLQQFDPQAPSPACTRHTVGGHVVVARLPMYSRGMFAPR
jgi:hypothetical protein